MTDQTPALFAGQNLELEAKKQADMAKRLKESAAEGSVSGLPEGGVYISFSGKTGTYSIGPDKADADPDELWLVNIYDMQKGWVCWKGGSPVAKRFGSTYGDPIPVPDMEEHGPFNDASGDGWFPAKSLALKSIDRGIQGLFQNNSKSGVGEFSKLEDAIADQINNDEPQWPLITLGRAKFKAQGQTNSKPILEVYGWLGTKQVQKLAQMQADGESISDAIDDLIDEAASGDHQLKVEGFDDDEDDAKTGGAEVDAETEADAEVEDDWDDVEDVDYEAKEAEEVEEEKAEKPRRRRRSEAKEDEAKPRRRRRAAV